MKLLESSFAVPAERGMPAEVHFTWSEDSRRPGVYLAWQFGWIPMQHSAIFEPQIVTRREDLHVNVRLHPNHAEIEFPWRPGQRPRLDDRALRAIGMANYAILIDMAARFSKQWPNRESALRYAMARG